MNVWNILLNGQEYLITLVCMFIISTIIKNEKLFSKYSALSLHHNRKLQLVATSLFTGIIPIENRIKNALPLYKELVHDERVSEGLVGPPTRKLGIVCYLATHHYYLWSPVEKSIILLMAGLHISYSMLIAFLLPFLVTYLAYYFYFILKYISFNDIEENPRRSWFSFREAVLALIPFLLCIGLSFYYPTYYVFPLCVLYYLIKFKTSPWLILKGINYLRILQFFVFIAVSNYVKENANQVYLMSLTGPDVQSLVLFGMLLSLVSLSAFAIGTSVGYAFITVIFCNIFGLDWFPLIFALGYLSYIASPAHRCIMIAYSFFRTHLVEFYITISRIAVFFLAISLLEMSLMPK